MRKQEDQPEGGAARPACGGGPRQYLCLRGTVSRAFVAATAGRDAVYKEGRADRSRQAIGRRHSRGAQPGHQGWRLIAAGPPPDLGRTRLFPAFVSSLRSRRQEMPDRGLRRDRSAGHAERALYLLVSEVPEVRFGGSHSGARGARATMCNCTSENLVIPGLVLRTIPE